MADMPMAKPSPITPVAARTGHTPGRPSIPTVPTHIANPNAPEAEMTWAAMSIFRRSSLSARAPDQGARARVARNCRTLTIPTRVLEPVSWNTTIPAATFWNQLPTFETKFPPR